VTGWFEHDGLGLHWREDGDPQGLPVLLLNSLGTDLRLWDAVVAQMPAGLRIIRIDTRGHGLSDAPDELYALDELVRDVEALIDDLDLRDLVIAGVSLGGMMAQSLAARRPELVRALLLSNTGLCMGDKRLWHDRILTVSATGLLSIADAILDRWFAPAFRHDPDIGRWRNMLVRTSPIGYAGCCGALADADLRATAPRITCPTLVLAGTDDGASPPSVVREVAEAISDARFVELSGVGHLPMVEAPDRFAAMMRDILKEHSRV
jgi:3-oxoadipate enol-lactonase